MADRIKREVDDLLTKLELYYRAMASPLDHADPDLRFCINTIPELDIHELGRDIYTFHSASHAHIPATPEQAKEGVQRGQLASGDTVIYAYRINGPDIPICVSISKVTNFQHDGVTPKRLVHIWPLEYHNKAIDLFRLRNNEREIEDRRK